MDAAAGYFTAAAGFGVFMFSHLAGTGLVPILGVSFAAALAAVALIVALAALAWAILNTDDALETWLKHGPFGKEEPASTGTFTASRRMRSSSCWADCSRSQVTVSA